MLKKMFAAGLVLMLSACTTVPVDLKIPKKFYADETGQCEIKQYGTEITARNSKEKIQSIIGLDWQRHHTEKSTSLRVDHEPLSKPIAFLSAAAHHAATHQNPQDIAIVVSYIHQIAANNQFMNTLTREQSAGIQCYAGGNTSAPCPSHAPQHLAINLTTYLISAIWMRDHLSPDEFKTIDRYIDRAYSRYIEAYASRLHTEGFTEMANLGIGRLAYATWKKDHKLAATEFQSRFKQLDYTLEDTGYIKGNSYRGVRGIFYHSMGVDVVLTYIQLAKSWNYAVPDQIMTKAKKSAELINVYSRNPGDFYSFPDHKIPYNSSRNPAEAAGIHQQAIALGVLMKQVVGVEFLSEPRYDRLRRLQFIDVMVGFDPHCMFPETQK